MGVMGLLPPRVECWARVSPLEDFRFVPAVGRLFGDPSQNLSGRGNSEGEPVFHAGDCCGGNAGFNSNADRRDTTEAARPRPLIESFKSAPGTEEGLVSESLEKFIGALIHSALTTTWQLTGVDEHSGTPMMCLRTMGDTLELDSMDRS